MAYNNLYIVDNSSEDQSIKITSPSGALSQNRWILQPDILR